MEISKEKIKKDLVDNSKKNSKSNQSNISIINKKNDEKINDVEFKNLVIKKNINFHDNKEVKVIRYYEDNYELAGTNFEIDTVYYLFKILFSISPKNDFSILYNLTPDIDKINPIFGKYGLFIIKKIQFDFMIVNLRISDLIKLIIDIYPGIHPNSKISLNIKNNNFLSLEELNKLKNQKENDEERIDILGEIGVNIFNEEEKSQQLLKYAKLIHNINQLIQLKESNTKANELTYILDKLHLNGNNKKLLLFMTDGLYSSFINIKNNNFLEIQKNLNIDSLLVFRDKRDLFRTRLLEKLVKKYKKGENNNFNKDLDKKYEELIKHLFISNNYEKVVKRLSKVAKKIEYIKNDLYKYLTKINDFKELCYEIMKSIIENENFKILLDKFQQIKETHFRNIMSEDVNPKKNYYIISDKEKKFDKEKEILIIQLKKMKISFIESYDLDVIKEKKSIILKQLYFLWMVNIFQKIQKR